MNNDPCGPHSHSLTCDPGGLSSEKRNRKVFPNRRQKFKLLTWMNGFFLRLASVSVLCFVSSTLSCTITTNMDFVVDSFLTDAVVNGILTNGPLLSDFFFWRPRVGNREWESPAENIVQNEEPCRLVGALTNVCVCVVVYVGTTSLKWSPNTSSGQIIYEVAHVYGTLHVK